MSERTFPDSSVQDVNSQSVTFYKDLCNVIVTVLE